MKYYLNEIQNNKYIYVFDEIQNNFTEDEDGRWFTTDKDDFDWWSKLADSIEFLEENDIDYSDDEINELADYITIAEEHK